MQRFASIAADSAILDVILTSNLSRLNDWQLNWNAFLFGHKRYVWWFHTAEITLQTVKKTCNCRYKQTQYSAGPTKSVAIGQGFLNWDTCTHMGTLAYPKGYI